METSASPAGAQVYPCCAARFLEPTLWKYGKSIGLGFLGGHALESALARRIS